MTTRYFKYPKSFCVDSNKYFAEFKTNLPALERFILRASSESVFQRLFGDPSFSYRDPNRDFINKIWEFNFKGYVFLIDSQELNNYVEIVIPNISEDEFIQDEYFGNLLCDFSAYMLLSIKNGDLI